MCGASARKNFITDKLLCVDNSEVAQKSFSTLDNLPTHNRKKVPYVMKSEFFMQGRGEIISSMPHDGVELFVMKNRLCQHTASSNVITKYNQQVETREMRQRSTSWLACERFFTVEWSHKINWVTHLLLISWNPPSSSRILANSTAFKNGTSIISSRFKSTSNLYFFFFIINAIPGALPSKVINKLKLMPFLCFYRINSNFSYHTFCTGV